MEQLLFAARKLVQSMNSGADDPEGHHPDFAIPEDWAHLTAPPSATLHHPYLDVQEIGGKGQGLVAKQDMAAGTMILLAKPIAMVLDSEADDDVADGAPAVPAADPSETVNDEDERMDEGDEEQEEDDGLDDDDVEEDDANVVTDNDNEDDKDPRINELLLLEVLDQLNSDPSLWENSLSRLFPRTDAQVAQLPAWICHDDDIFVEIENGVKALERQHDVLKPHITQISKRLPLILRYNILSMETCPELLSYPSPEGYAKLSGVGLYHLPSFFNHARRPNVARYAFGDVMCFVTNQAVSAGTELCISYIESDVLCESAYRRNLLLSMNFDDAEPTEAGAIPSDAERDGPEMPVVDSDVQNELMTMGPLERLSSIDELLAQATGQKGPDDEEEEEVRENAEDRAAMDTSATSTRSGWFQCDIQNLRILKAITLEGLGQSRQALALWGEAIQFGDSQLPPLDENTVVLRVQAALTCWHLGDVAQAQQHAAVALQTHHLLFGGGVAFFRIRMGPDLRLSLRPTSRNGVAAADALWPYA